MVLGKGGEPPKPREENATPVGKSLKILVSAIDEGSNSMGLSGGKRTLTDDSLNDDINTLILRLCKILAIDVPDVMNMPIVPAAAAKQSRQSQ
ncbi:conserved hypothetical protein [Ricinus communis]|uniref:Uncharacterized protein n=1 Tax=Ricinus communis TaxID=3988 RepID=B9S853_RICCO|nr:conserved hypothetical protein [Ricinus communis]